MQLSKLKIRNLLHPLPGNTEAEFLEEILKSGNLRIERVISRGNRAPETGWFDQDENEWVLVLQGRGELQFADGSSCRLEKGDCLNIPAHCRHKVSWTDPDEPTVWLAVFHSNPDC